MEDTRSKKSHSVQGAPYGLDRRHARRMASEIEVHFREVPLTEDEEAPHVGYTLNVCASGAFLRTTKTYRAGTMLELLLDIPDAKDRMRHLTILARVAWVSREREQEGMGVEFQQMDTRTRQILLAHVWRSDWHV